MSKPNRGRRPAGSGTREAIIEAARVQFSERGYRGTTLRRVGTAAGVDPRLVLHYFGSKQQLFAQSLELPAEPDAIIEGLFAPGPGSIGTRAANLLLDLLDDLDSQRVLVAIIRAAASEPEAAELIREILTERILGPLAEHVGGPDPELRASLMGSQIVGLAMARHVVGLAPLASASREELVAALAPVFDHYLGAPTSGAAQPQRRPPQDPSGSPS
jgi:AcrR family transcriptional regulator